MRKTLLLVCPVFCLVLGNGFAQNPYYWSGGQKITLIPDSTQILVTLRQGADAVRSRSRVESFGNTVSSEMKIGGNTNLLAANVKEYAVLEKSLYSVFPDHLFHIPVFRSGRLPVYFTNRILVQPKLGIGTARLLQLTGGKATVAETTRYGVVVLQVSRPEDLFASANRIYESGLAEWCHPDFLALIEKSLVPDDPLYADQYYLNNTGQAGGFPGIDINAPEAWDITRGCNNIRVAVLDDGVEDHEDLAGRVLAGFTPVNGGNGRPNRECIPNPNPTLPGNRVAHGMACTGIIAASHNGLGVAGVAPNAQIVPVNIFAGGETIGNLANAINFAWDPVRGNADIISNSWGFTQPQAQADAITQAITNARTQGRVRNGVARGCVVVFASGNSNPRNGCPNPSNNCFDGVTFPANIEGVITVGAINNSTATGAIWDYSSRGAAMDLVAPSGGAAGQILYEGCLIPTGDVRTLDRMGLAGYTTGNYVNTFNGTSAACPQVSGVAALMLSVNPNLTETQVRTILQQTATDMGGTGFDNTFGFGRLNAEAALKRVLLDAGIAIAGAGPVCTSSTFSLSNAPAGSTITWSSSNTGGLTITSGGVATRVTGYDGPVTLTATAATACGNTSIARTVWVGNTSTNSSLGVVFINGPTSPQAFTRTTYSLNRLPTEQGTLVTRWEIPPTIDGWRRLSVSPTSISVSVGDSPGRILFFWRNECSQEISTEIWVQPVVSFRLTVFPNPADAQLNVAATGTENPSTPDGAPVDGAQVVEMDAGIRLMDAYSQTLWEGVMKKGRVTVPTAKIRDGLYYLIIGGKQPVTKQVMIRH